MKSSWECKLVRQFLAGPHKVLIVVATKPPPVRSLPFELGTEWLELTINEAPQDSQRARTPPARRLAQAAPTRAISVDSPLRKSPVREQKNPQMESRVSALEKDILKLRGEVKVGFEEERALRSKATATIISSLDNRFAQIMDRLPGPERDDSRRKQHKTTPSDGMEA
jgi:hypothetical protein